MIEKKFRPFWSYDVQKTESWLAELARDGWRLVQFNSKTRQFIFQKSQPKKVTYHIEFQRSHLLSHSLIEEGWEKAVQSGKWIILCNERPSSEIRAFPLHEGIYKRTRKWMYLYMAVFGYMVISSLLPLSLTIMSLVSGSDVTIVGSPYWLVTIFAAVVFWSLVPYSTIKLYRSNQRLMNSQQSIDRALKQSKAKKEVKEVRKWKFGWQFSPDKLEEWLEKMEEEGYQLQRISFSGVRYHFVKHSSRKVRYAVDYYKKSHQPGYFDIHRETGWRLMFVSKSTFSKWAICSKEYTEIPPQFYSDREEKMDHAKRVAVTFTSIYGTLTFLYVINFTMLLDIQTHAGVDRLSWMLYIIYGVVVVEFVWLAIKPIAYYLRVKKSKQIS
ncbi:DUF2812 domain-containing protein [Halobacillus sp. BBL2006]|uniref:DUF2812 domain-containing protein n=1 Tax=Halobacillus sp. BBL2006 TaxID=1543706 RepID=UPI000543BF10|nr:DUF2812 domain-containing protein [Halobacillus sp. BBL2006]KHE70683.1 hypothetical protein LD39_11310 [Halobacillus sp. BBL2006]